MENKKIRWKLNLFDLLVILLALAVAAGIVWMRYQQNRAAQAAQDAGGASGGSAVVRYVVELDEMSLQAAEMVAPGDALVERTRKQAMGTVESVEVALTRTLTKDQTTGNYHFVEIPERYTATMVVTDTATVSDSSIVSSGGLEIRAGTSVRVFGPGYYGSGYIVSVERG